MYRSGALAARKKKRTRAVARPIAAPCHTNSMSASAIARTNGLAASVSVMDFPLLRAAALGGQQPPDFTKLVGRRAAAGECMDHELRRRSAERAVEKVGHQPPQRFLLRVARPVQMLAAMLLADREPLLGHDLE